VKVKGERLRVKGKKTCLSERSEELSLERSEKSIIRRAYYFVPTHEVLVFSSPLERGRVGIEGGRGVFIRAMKRTHPSTPLKRGIAQPSASSVVYIILS
jgi:hypothetical protein